MLESAPVPSIKIAFTRAIAATFDRARWVELASRTGRDRFLLDHPQLLRSRGPGDRDYVEAVAEVVPALLGQKTYGGRIVALSNLADLEAFVGLQEWLATNDAQLYVELYGADPPAPAPSAADLGSGSADRPDAGDVRPAALPSGPLADRRRVFLVHGRDLRTRDALADLLRAFDLRIVDWDEASRLTGVTTPYTGDVVTAGMDASDGVVVLMTPDDLARVHPDFLCESDGQAELALTGQPRMNVIFEAGMALARDRDRVVIVQVGVLRVMSDIAGLNVIQLGDDIESRRQLGRRLHAAGLAVEMDHDRWRTAGVFTAARTDVDGALVQVD